MRESDGSCDARADGVRGGLRRETVRTEHVTARVGPEAILGRKLW